MHSSLNSYDSAPPMSDDRKSSCSNKIIDQKVNRELKKIYAKKQTIEECLSTLDIFKNIMEDADQMKGRIIRDVAKSIFISSFDEGDPIYDVQDESNQIFLVFHGQVSLKIKKRVEPEKSAPITQQEPREEEFTYDEVETYEKGQGFGEAEFIRGRSRDFRAQVKAKGSIIGRLHIESFDEVVQNYKMRVYYKKLEMFKKCPLLSEISGNRLEFLVNSSKPVLLGMSKNLVRQGETPKCLYLVSKGQLEMVNNEDKLNLSPRPIGGWKSKKLSKYFINPHESKEKLQIRKVNEGAFIGDVEIALNKTFGYDAVTASQKVYLYALDIRLLLSQIPTELLEQSKLFYEQKLHLQQNQLNEIKQIRKVATENAQFSFCSLTPDQIKIKKQIRNRYLNTVPFSLVDESSPQQIYKMIERKHSRIKTEIVELKLKSQLPALELFERRSASPKKRRKNVLMNSEPERLRNYSIDLNNFSPFYTKIQQQRIKSERQYRSLSAVYTEERSKKEKPSSPKKKITLPPIVSIAMMKKRTQSAEKKKKETQQRKDVRFRLKKSDEYSMNHRMSEFILKIQLLKQTQTSEEKQ